MKQIAYQKLTNALSYSAYRTLIDQLMEQDKTTGDNHSEAMLGYTKLNVSRMRRLDKTTRLTEEALAALQQIDRPLVWLVLTEAWCGDAAQIIPVLEKMAEASSMLELKLILRDEHLDIMDSFLTNNGRSIPKLIILDAETGDVLADWGPRPAVIQQAVLETKTIAEQTPDPEQTKALWDESKKDTQRWYARDKTKSIQAEVVEVTIGVATPV